MEEGEPAPIKSAGWWRTNEKRGAGGPGGKVPKQMEGGSKGGYGHSRFGLGMGIFMDGGLGELFKKRRNET